MDQQIKYCNQIKHGSNWRNHSISVEQQYIDCYLIYFWVWPVLIHCCWWWYLVPSTPRRRQDSTPYRPCVILLVQGGGGLVRTGQVCWGALGGGADGQCHPNWPPGGAQIWKSSPVLRSECLSRPSLRNAGAPSCNGLN